MVNKKKIPKPHGNGVLYLLYHMETVLGRPKEDLLNQSTVNKAQVLHNPALQKNPKNHNQYTTHSPTTQ